MHILDLRAGGTTASKQPREQKHYRAAAIVLGLLFVGFLGLNSVFAWSNPTQAPPLGGPAALPVTSGGTGATSATGARSSLGAAASGTNSDITSITGLTTPLPVNQGGTGAANLSGLLLGNGTGSFTALVGGVANDVLTWSGTNWVSQAPAGGGSSSIVFSNGSDGDVIIASSATLTRDWHYNNLTVNGGVTLNTNGYRVLVAGTLTNNGTIENSGGAGGTLNAGGSGGSGGCGCGGSNCGCPGCGVPTAGASKNPSLGSSGGNGGNGGSCSNSGAGGSATSEQAQIVKQVIPTSTNLPSGGETVITSVGDLNYLLASGATSGITGSASAGGGGGGGGSGSADGGPGGGGGQGGGIVFISAQTFNNVGTVRANGNNGGGGGNGYVGAFPGGGGGGGGGGGVVVIFYRTLTNLGTVTVNGGSGGSGGSSGGQAGAAGALGKIYRAKINF